MNTPGYQDALRRIESIGADGKLDLYNLKLTQCPPLPITVKILNCSRNQLEELPKLPEGLHTLLCNRNKLKKLPKLPSTLVHLECENNNIQALPELKEPLSVLKCGGHRNLAPIPSLPQTLTVFDCRGNRYQTLPELPQTLFELNCESNQLTVLPVLPQSLMELKCSNNLLKTLPELPLTLITLDCNTNLLTQIPELPESLTVFSCNNNPLIDPFATYYAIYDASMVIEHLRASIHRYYQSNPVHGSVKTTYEPEKPAYPAYIDHERIDYYYNYVTKLTELQQYTISQYSFHGDVILNAMLRGNDTIDLYTNNIITPFKAVQKYPLMQVSCLYLYLLEPLLAENEYLKASSPGIRRIAYYQLDSHVKPPSKTLNRWNDPYQRNNGRRNLPIADFTAFKKEMLEIYSDRIYPQLRDRLLAFDLDYFRRLTYESFKIIYNAIQATVPSLPPSLKRGNGFITYRGVTQFYLPTTKQPILVNSFTSTTAIHDTIYNFYMGEPTGGIYQFIVAPNTPCLYVESITYVFDEYEYLFPPGVRFVYICNYKNDRGETVQIFLALPPLPDSPVGIRVPDRYEDYMQWASTIEWTRQPYSSPANAPAPIMRATEIISLLVDIVKYMAPDSESTPEELAALSARVPDFAPVHAEALSILPIRAISENNLYNGGARTTGVLKRRTQRTRRTRRMRGGRVAVMNPVQNRFNGKGITRKLNKGKKLTRAPPPVERNTILNATTRPVHMDTKVSTVNTANMNVATRVKGDRWDTSQPVQYAVSKFTAKEAAYMKLIEKIIEKNTRS